MTAPTRRLSGCLCCSAPPPPGTSRRQFVAGGIGALGLGLAGRPARAQAPAKTRIDVHHHIIPPVHAEALAKHKSSASAAALCASGHESPGHHPS